MNLEIDMATEGQKQIRGKLAACYRAWSWSGGDWPEHWYQRDAAGNVIYDKIETGGQLTLEPRQQFPRTIWVAVDAERARELRWIISSMPSDAQTLFQVTQLEHMPSLLVG